MKNRAVASKLISFLLCALLAFGLMSGIGGTVQARADFTNVGDLANLKSALQNSDSEINISFNGNINVSETLVIKTGKTVNIDSVSWARALNRAVGFTGDLIVVEDGASLTLTNVILDGNKSQVSANGSLVHVEGTLNLKNDAILRNNNTTGDGGAVYVAGGGIFNMSGGEISGNKAAVLGDGVYLQGVMNISGAPKIGSETDTNAIIRGSSDSAIVIDGSLSGGAYINVDMVSSDVAGKVIATKKSGAVTDAEAGYFNYLGESYICTASGSNVSLTTSEFLFSDVTVTSLPSKTVYTVGDALDLSGIEVTAEYRNGILTTFDIVSVSKIATSPAVGAALNTVGDQTITVSYTDNGVTQNTEFTVKVEAAPVVLDSIAVTSNPTKTAYVEGDALDLAGLIIMATYSDGSSKAVTEYTTSPANGEVLDTGGDQTITVSYTDNGVTENATFTVNVESAPVVLDSIAVTSDPTKTAYVEGDALDLAGLIVMANYNDGSSKVVTEYTTSPANGAVLGTIGNQTVTVSYTDNGVTENATLTVKVEAVPVILSGISLTARPTITTYTEGDALSLAGMVVTATYSDGSSKAVTGFTTNPDNGTVLNTIGDRTVTVSYTEGGVTRTANFSVTVRAVPVIEIPMLQSIAIASEPAKTEYISGDALNLEGIAVTATYSDGSSKSITAFTTIPANGAALNTVGDQEVTVSYTDNGVTRSERFTVAVGFSQEEKEELAEINHTDEDTGITISGDDLPWYVQIEVELITEFDEQYAAFLENIPEDDFELLVLFDIKLLDANPVTGTLTGGYYEPSEGETVTVEMGNISLTDAENILIAHEKKDGTIELIEAEVIDGKVVFTATSFSLYGVIATDKPIKGLENGFVVFFSNSGNESGAPARTGDDSNMMLWYLSGCAALIVLGALAVAQLRKKRSRM